MFGIGGTGQMGYTQNFLAAGLTQSLKPTCSKNIFLLGFRPLYFGILKKCNNKKGEKKNENGEEWLRVPRYLPFHLGGRRYRKKSNGRTNNIANLFFLSGRTASRWEYDSYDSLISDIAPLL